MESHKFHVPNHQPQCLLVIYLYHYIYISIYLYIYTLTIQYLSLYTHIYIYHDYPIIIQYSPIVKMDQADLFLANSMAP